MKKDNKLTYLKQRVLYLSDLKGFKREEFFKKINMSYASFKGEAKKRPLNSDALYNILTLIPDANPRWIICHYGEPLTDENQNHTNINQKNKSGINSIGNDNINFNGTGSVKMGSSEKENTIAELRQEIEELKEEKREMREQIKSLTVTNNNLSKLIK